MQLIFLITCIVCFNVVNAFAVLGPVHTIILVFFRNCILCSHESAISAHKTGESAHRDRARLKQLSREG